MEKYSLVTCFLAYPSQPKSLVETIESAIQRINEIQIVKAIGWRSLLVTGRVVIKEICAAIDQCNMFACDMTFLNPNVLFELGYAVARNKRIWITLDSSYDSAISNYKHFKMLTNVGYAEYHNTNGIVKSFTSEQPYLHLEKTLYNDVVKSSLEKSGMPTLLYLKSAVDTEASVQLARRLEKSPIPLVTDDPTEIAVQTLAWYTENVRDAHAVITHLLDDTRAEGFSIQNAKYSFVSGFAYGLGKPLLMVAHAPYDPPFDYQELLRIHHSAAECTQIVDEWLGSLETDYQVVRQKVVSYQRDISAVHTLQRINLGDHFAENEQRELLDYFIVTAPYTEALHLKQSMIYVGRKGSGKTANLYMIAHELEQSKQNHVCVIRPVDYDIEGVFNLLKLNVPKAEHGYMIESLWKFLIYTQLAISLRENIINRPSYTPITDEEQDFIAFVEHNLEIIESDFTVRLENALHNLCQITPSNIVTEQRTKISEILHSRLLSSLRERMGKLLHDKKKVCILIDNLDKSWESRTDLPALSDFIFGLLNVARSISDEFHRSGPSWRDVNLSVLVFLRSDIFSYIMADAREVDKLAFSTIHWDDEQLLQRVIEDRFLSSLNQIAPADVWIRFFSEFVNATETKQYLVQHIIPRPRDIIYLCKESLSSAINRGHSKIEEEDIIFAEGEYSEYAYFTLVSETKPRFSEIEAVLVEFAGAPEVITRTDFEKFLTRAQVDVQRASFLIDLLADSLFLGLETEVDRFRFLYDERRKNVLKSLARSVAESKGVERFKINVPFHNYLEITHI